MEDSTEEDIDSLIEGMAYIPGHFHLELHLNGDPSGPALLRQRDTQLKSESLRAELEAETGRLQYAVRNMLGLLAFHMDELEVAEEAFRTICQEDPENLNAWANMGYVYERMGRELEEGECMERVAALMGPEMGENQADCRLRVARCLAEQAYAHPHDVELERDEDSRERLTTALMLYNRALDYGGEQIPTEEKRSWNFKMATIYIRLDGIVRDSKDTEDTRLIYFNKALKLLTETIKSDNTHLKALGWCYIGLMLERTDFTTVPMSVHDCGFSGSDPLTCYGSAIKLAAEDAFILNRLGNVFFLSGKLDMATGICNMALSILPDAELNWQAYCTRAKLGVTIYAKDLDKAKCGLGGIPDRKILKEARVDLERVLAVRPCLRTHLEMGQVYYYMGVDALQESLLVDEIAINHALVSLAKALQCPLGSTISKLQLLRGRCLLLKGEEKNAIDCFKKALELEHPSVRDMEVLRCLLQAVLVSFTQSGRDTDDAIVQFEECLKQAEERYGRNIVQTELKALCRAHTDEVTELSRDLVRKGRLEVVKKLLQCVQPQGIKYTLGRSMSI
ncbi:tetratricopeptide repeat protein 22 [Triplophysa rosa]|uniref:Tetratricopeptide repeat protein 22 n=1 Tax=Triplophysa rosa TaxID=992332 RepID=A0A9W7WS28_TRIRA|nr:tetratricopeptide repeat protein 22 [Triplophysa rosa]KAI7807293.1 putative tetratricopeptide repeat protein 22 [Triplophysa rosa]